MAITINGTSNTVTGLAAGGLPDNTIDNGSMADDAIGVAELSATGTASSSTFLRGDNSWAAPAAGGITYADQWRISANFTAAAEPVTANWERIDGTAQGTLGSAMTVSSGVFTFPATGIWYVAWNVGFGSTEHNQWVQIHIDTSANAGVSWSEMAYAWTDIYHETATHYTSASTNTLMDVDDVSNVKCRFSIQNQHNPTYQGTTNSNATWATFIRLADT